MSAFNTFDVNESIAAIASPPGPAYRGVIRLSGPVIHHALARCFHASSGQQLDEIVTASVLNGRITVPDPIFNVVADLYYWPTAASYTRQRSAEIHCSGAAPILDEIMRVLAEWGVRQAQPGEFTLRAFLAGRIDLPQAEAVLGVIDSSSDREMEIALQQLSGGLSGPIEDLQNRLLDVLAHIEAGLDFVEDDIEFISQPEVQNAIDESLSILQAVIQKIDMRQISRRRQSIVLTGRPNAGKSCLQNLLCGKTSAIVSDVAGTTRDYLVGQMTIDGNEVDLIDTAGTFRDQETDPSEIQQQAEVQADQAIASADLIVVCVDGHHMPDDWERAKIGEIEGKYEKTGKTSGKRILVRTKSDLPMYWDSDVAISVCSLNGTGIAELRQQIARCLDTAQNSNSGQIVSSTANRCYESLKRSCEELILASGYCQRGQGEEIIAASLRSALDEFAIVTGKIYTDDILERVFSRFCIGK